MTVPLDQPVRLTFLTYSDAARTTLADPTTVALDLADPAGLTTTSTWAGGQVVRDSVGTFHIDVTPSTAGHYSFHWRSTGSVATSQDGSFDVEPKYGTTWPTLATTQDLQDYLQNPAIDENAAALALTLATALIQSETRQHLFYVANDTVTLAGGERHLYLPQRPVVGAPTVAGLAPSALYRFDPPDQLTYGIPAGSLAGWFYSNAPDAAHGRWPLQVTVTYSHGYQTIPDDLRAVCLSVAARSVTNPQGLRGETLGPYSVQYAGGGDILTAGVALTTAEQAILSRHRARNRSLIAQ